MVVSVIVAYEDTGSGRYSASSESCLTGATTVLVADFQAGIWDANWNNDHDDDNNDDDNGGVNDMLMDRVIQNQML